MQKPVRGQRGFVKESRSQRVALILGVAILAAVMLGGCTGRNEAAASHPTAASVDPRAVRLASAVRQYYASLLDSVSIGPRVVHDAGMGRDEFVSQYRLRGIPLTFPFRIAINARTVTAWAAGGAEGDRALMHADIGGVARFHKLVKQYHLDFPDQPTMSYWRTSDNGVASQEPYRSILRGHQGLSVVVYEFDDYWGDGTSRQLGIYWWNRRAHRWVLVHRGDLPDLR
jgi:hypothetical protein